MSAMSKAISVVALVLSSAILHGCGGGGGGGNNSEPASVVDNSITPNTNTASTTKASLNRSNALFLAGSALTISSASTNLYDIFVLTQQSNPQTTPARMAARTTLASLNSHYKCSDGREVPVDSYATASNAMTIVAHFNNCGLQSNLVVTGDITVVKTASGATLKTQDFKIEKDGKNYLYTVTSDQSWVPVNSTTVITGIESISIHQPEQAWTISTSGANIQMTLDNVSLETLTQSTVAKISSSQFDSVQLINNRITGDNNTSVKIGKNFVFWDLMSSADQSVDIDLDDNGDYTPDFFNTVALSQLLDPNAKSSNHAPALTTKDNAYYEKIASTLSINASDADNDFLSYDWKLVSATHSQYFFDQPHSSHPSFGATEAGDFQFVVTVSDGTVSQNLTVNVSVKPIDALNISAAATQLNTLSLAYGQDLSAQLSMADEDLNGAEVKVLSGPTGFNVAQDGTMSWINDHQYDDSQFKYSFGILRNGYWDKLWFGGVNVAAQ